jgi:hypothetical protein
MLYQMILAKIIEICTFCERNMCASRCFGLIKQYCKDHLNSLTYSGNIHILNKKAVDKLRIGREIPDVAWMYIVQMSVVSTT